MIVTGAIFRTFLMLGTTSFGGLAMIEPMRRRVVEDKGWLRERDFLDGLVLCQLLPGATVVQLATYVGYRLRGVRGALAAAAAFILPAFGLMVGLTVAYLEYGELPWVKAVSRGLGAVVVALLLQTLVRLSRPVREHWLDAALALAAAASLGLKLNYLAVFAAAGALRGLAGWVQGAGPTLAAPTAAGLRPGAPRGWGLLLLAPLAGLPAALLLLFLADRALAHLALLFVKIGLLSFGGGFVMIPILQWEVVDSLGWLTQRQFVDGILLSYITPGPLLILAAFVGFLTRGLAGAMVATAAIFSGPALLVIMTAPLFHWAAGAGWVRPVIQGILAATVGMIALVTVQIGLAAVTDWRTLGVMLGAAAALLGLDLPLPWIIPAAVAVSLMIF